MMSEGQTAPRLSGERGVVVRSAGVAVAELASATTSGRAGCCRRRTVKGAVGVSCVSTMATDLYVQRRAGRAAILKRLKRNWGVRASCNIES